MITVWLTWFKKLGAIPFDYEYISFLILNEYKLFLYFVRSIEIRINLVPTIMVRNHKNPIFSRAYHINIARQDTK